MPKVSAAVAFIHRFGSLLHLYTRLHVCGTECVFEPDLGGTRGANHRAVDELDANNAEAVADASYELSYGAESCTRRIARTWNKWDHCGGCSLDATVRKKR
jgi:hypothetical protein